MTTPPPDDPQTQPGERQALEQFLDYFRAVLRRKGEGLSDEQANTATCPPSRLTIVGLIRHMEYVENFWFSDVLGQRDRPAPYCTEDSPDEDIVPSAPASINDALAGYDNEVAFARSVAAEYQLDDTTVPWPSGKVFNLRWIYVHMIEEYARHCGHADLLRQAIDGATGD